MKVRKCDQYVSHDYSRDIITENNAVIYQMKELVINIINNITIDKADKEWQNQFLQVCEAQSACDIHFSQFSTGLNVINSQGQDLMPLVRRTSDAYIRAMNSLMNAARDRRAAIRDIDPVQSFLPPGKEEEQRKKKQFNLPYNLSNPAEETEALIALNNAIESILLDDPALPMQVIQQKQ